MKSSLPFAGSHRPSAETEVQKNTESGRRVVSPCNLLLRTLNSLKQILAGRLPKECKA